jgi:opacity protein-like surface antigen
MMRFGRVVMMAGAATMLLTSAARAQTSDPGKFAAQFTFGATFGNKASGSLGGEVDYKLGTEWEAFFEFGSMRNVASGNTEDRAQIIADAIGGTANVAEHAAYYNVGAKYLLVPFGGGYQPYVGLGIGAAHVAKDVVFSVNGAELSEEQLLTDYGVQLGADLAGSTTRPMLVVLGGVSRPFLRRYFLDVSYRYGYIFSSGSIEDDEGMNTQRLQLGIGIRF